MTAALTAYTAGSAWVNHLDDTGTIEVGKCAPTWPCSTATSATTPEAIADARVLATYVDGTAVYAS